MVVCVAIVTFVVLLVSSETTVDVVPGARNNNCQRVRRPPLVVKWPGCEDKETKVPMCTGTCNSYDVVKQSSPYFSKACSCCKSIEHLVKKRTLLFNCTSGMQNHTIFLPIIEKCGCVRCNV